MTECNIFRYFEHEGAIGCQLEAGHAGNHKNLALEKEWSGDYYNESDIYTKEENNMVDTKTSLDKSKNPVDKKTEKTATKKVAKVEKPSVECSQCHEQTAKYSEHTIDSKVVKTCSKTCLVNYVRAL